MDQGSQGQWNSAFWNQNSQNAPFGAEGSRARSATFGYDLPQQQQYQTSQFPGQDSQDTYYGNQNQAPYGEIELSPLVNLNHPQDNGNIDLIQDINQVLNSHSKPDVPWTPFGAFAGPPQRAPLPSRTSFPEPSRSETGAPVYGHELVRTTSAVSASDSGYASFNVTCGPSNDQGLTASAQAQHLTFISNYGATAFAQQGTPGPGSVASDPTLGSRLQSSPASQHSHSRSHRRPIKPPPPPCRPCGKQQKNPSEAA